MKRYVRKSDDVFYAVPFADTHACVVELAELGVELARIDYAVPDAPRLIVAHPPVTSAGTTYRPPDDVAAVGDYVCKYPGGGGVFVIPRDEFQKNYMEVF